MNEKLLEIIGELETANRIGEELIEELVEQVKDVKKLISDRNKKINTLKAMMEEI